MEKISEQDIQFLIALAASEEAMLVEIVWEFEKWECGNEVVLKLLSGLIEDETILIYRHEAGETFDYSKSESLSLVSDWSSLDRKDHMLYLTDKGGKRWEMDDWGITTKRARHLMFTNNGKVSRVKGR
jgi:hypothetical protein